MNFKSICIDHSFIRLLCVSLAIVFVVVESMLKRKFVPILFVTLLAFLAVIPVARAETVKLYPTDDCFVSFADPDGNYNYTYLSVRADNLSGGYILRSYLKFDLTGIDSERICGATLYLYCWAAAIPPDFMDVDAAATGDYYDGTTTPWNESGLTWNNAPPPLGLEVTTPVDAGGWYSWDGEPIKNEVKWQCEHDGIVSFVMKLTVENTSNPCPPAWVRHFHSKEWSGAEPHPPYLEITLHEVGIPEFALAVPIITSLGAIAIFLRKKR